jgi:hypothetical protein
MSIPHYSDNICRIKQYHHGPEVIAFPCKRLKGAVYPILRPSHPNFWEFQNIRANKSLW